MDYQETINQKRAQTAQDSASRQSLESLIREMREATLATYATGNKSQVILADSTDLGERVNTINTNLEKLLGENSKLVSDTSAGTSNLVKELSSSIKEFNKVLPDNTPIISKLDELLKFLQRPPEITVKASDVQMNNVIDVEPISRVLKEHFDVPQIEKLDMSTYRAQDIIDNKDKQYVGFLNPEGAWYIVENDVKGNKLRYVFGNSGYAKAFGSATSYQYELLNEAVDAA